MSIIGQVFAGARTVASAFSSAYNVSHHRGEMAMGVPGTWYWLEGARASTFSCLPFLDQEGSQAIPGRKAIWVGQSQASWQMPE